MGNSKVWLFRGLVVVAAGLMVVSWLLPWWAASAAEYGDVIIYPYGLRHSLGDYAIFIEGAEMPGWFAPLMWIYLAASVGLLLYSTLLMGKRGKLLLGGVGLSYIIVAVIAVIVAAIRTGDFNMSLMGTTHVMEYPAVDAEASLRFGYWMAYGAGLLSIALALLRDKIIGKPKLNA